MPVARVVMSTSLSPRPSPRVYGAPWRLHSGKGLSPRSGRFGDDDGDGAAGYAGRLAVLVRYVDLPRLAHAPQVSRDAECTVRSGVSSANSGPRWRVTPSSSLIGSSRSKPSTSWQRRQTRAYWRTVRAENGYRVFSIEKFTISTPC